MQNVCFDRPYVFVPPSRGTGLTRALWTLLPWRLRRGYGIVSVACRGTEKLKASLDAGDGVMLTPNHCRPSDPEVIHEMCRQGGVAPYLMASWHLFMQNPLQAYVLRSTGTFSIYREGTDRAAIATAIELLSAGGRPLVIFPEGVTTRANDRLNPLLEGAAFIARMAARDRVKKGSGRVVVHPVAIRYRYRGDVRKTVEPVLTQIERRLSWRPQSHLPIEERLAKLGTALLSVKEIEVFGRPYDGPLAERLERLIDGLLVPLEREWLAGKRERHVIARAKALRTAVIQDMLQHELPEDERRRRWDQMADVYTAQSLSFYPPDYLTADPTPERLLETVERFEEDLTDVCRPHPPLEATVTVGDAILVTPTRERGDHDDPLLGEIAARLEDLLGIARPAARRSDERERRNAGAVATADRGTAA